MKGSFDPLHARLGGIDVVDGNDVEANGLREPRRMVHQEVARGVDDSPLLARTDGFNGTTARSACARSDLDDDESRSVDADQVELAESATVAAGDDVYATFREELRGRVLPSFPGSQPRITAHRDSQVLWRRERRDLWYQQRGAAVTELRERQIAPDLAERIKVEPPGETLEGPSGRAERKQGADERVGIET